MAQQVRDLPAMQETQETWVSWKIPWRRKWQSIAEFLPEKFHGQRSLADYSPRGHRQTGLGD